MSTEELDDLSTKFNAVIDDYLKFQWTTGPIPPDPVNHPKHYTSHPSGVECIEITQHMGFSLGNAIKYIWRADLKGNAIEDIEKAIWYLNQEIKRRKEMDA
jgi:hypothetical protein